MAKPIRSPVLGFNHNVKYRGRIFHVQTEDSGPISPRIFTHLYFGGTILASKKHEYDPTAPEDVVRALMQSQHKSILKELKGGRHEVRIKDFFASRGETLDAVSAPPGRDAGALDLDAAPAAPAKRPAREDVAVGTTFADTFDDEPTTLDPPEYSAVSATAASDVLEETHVLPTPPPVPATAAAAAPPSPSSTAPYPTSTGLAQELARRRVTRGTPVMGGPVVVQRTVAVGGGDGAGGAKAPLRARRPAQSIPYVVKEGTHPLAEPAEPASQLDLPLNNPTAPTAQGRPNPAPGSPPAPEPVADRSLDEVILAYLAGGENDQR
jgi:hypothetical protein